MRFYDEKLRHERRLQKPIFDIFEHLWFLKIFMILLNDEHSVQ